MATAIEYGLIAAGISVAIVVTVHGLGSQLKSISTAVQTEGKRPAPIIYGKPRITSTDARGYSTIESDWYRSYRGWSGELHTLVRPNGVMAIGICKNPQISLHNGGLYTADDKGNGWDVKCDD